MNPQQSKYWDVTSRTFYCSQELIEQANMSADQAERIAMRRNRQYDAGYMVYRVRPKNRKLP